MKKCPKCGTILDDSKKKCYMCGADLNNDVTKRFDGAFDNPVGANTTSGQNNVFSNGLDFSVKGKDVVNKNGNSSYFSQDSSSATVFGNPNKKDDVPLTVPVFKPEPRQYINKSGNTMNVNNNQNQKSIPKKTPKAKKVKQPKIPKIKKEKKDSSITWGNTMGEGTHKFNKAIKGVSFATIFNFLCLIISICFIIFIYFHFVKNKNDKNVLSIGDLTYEVDEAVRLEAEDKYSRYYMLGDSCAFKIYYGETNDVAGFVDNYFEQVKAEYESQDGLTTRIDELKINDNLWSSLSIVEFGDNQAAIGGISSVIRYKYTSIVYNNHYYKIIYVNTENSSECSNVYDDFIDTLDFKN